MLSIIIGIISVVLVSTFITGFQFLCNIGAWESLIFMLIVLVIVFVIYVITSIIFSLKLAKKVSRKIIPGFIFMSIIFYFLCIFMSFSILNLLSPC